MTKSTKDFKGLQIIKANFKGLYPSKFNLSFSNLLESKSKTHKTIEFTPKLARKILTTLNIGNRKDKPIQIKLYADSMRNNSWDDNGEALKFGWDGLLKDGQNRLKACIQANKKFKSSAFFGLDPKFFINYDTGKKRNAYDVFQIMGVKHAKYIGGVIRLMHAWENNQTSSRNIVMQNRDLQKIYNKDINKNLLEKSIVIAKPFSRKFPISHVASLYYIASKNCDGIEINKFMDDMKLPSTLGALNPIRKAITHISDMKFNKQTLSSHHYSIILTRAWDYYKNKKRLSAKDLDIKTNDRLFISEFSKV